MIKPNSVTLYLNGIFVIRFHVEQDFSQNKWIMLDVPKESTTNVLSTLTIFGEKVNIKEIYLMEERRWIPQFHDKNALAALIRSLIGREVEVKFRDMTKKGLVLGIERYYDLLVEENRNLLVSAMIFLEEDHIVAIPVFQIQEIKLKEKELTTLKSYLKSESEITNITISIEGEDQRKIFIEYADIGASWLPSYKLFINKENSIITGFAKCSNKTCYDWSNITLRFSTARPEFSTQKLFEKNIQESPPPKVRGLLAPKKAVPVTRTAAIELKGPPGIGVQNFIVENVSIKRKEIKNIPLFTKPIKVDFYSLWNTQGRYPIKRVKLNNTTGFELPAGNLAIYAEDTFVGLLKIQDLPRNGTCNLSIGIDSRLNVRKEQQLVKETTGLIRQGIKKAYETTLFIRNWSKEEIKLRIEDLPPEGIIKPQIINATHKPDSFEHGRYIWNLNLKPQEKVEIKFTYIYKEQK